MNSKRKPIEKNELDNNEKLEFLQWLINRFDELRASTANRAAIVVSADAILLAGVNFLIDKALSKNIVGLGLIVLFICIGLTTLLLVLSIIYATTGVVSVWKSDREILKGKAPGLNLFFHTRDSLNEFDDFPSFEKRFNKTNKEQLIKYGLGELWILINLNVRRNNYVIRSIKLLTFSIVAFAISLFIIFWI